MLKFSVRFNNDRPAAEYIRLAQAAERHGFDQFWVSDDLFLRSSTVILTSVAQATERIQIGTSIVNPYTLHPAQMAMEAATLDEVSGGRFQLGVSSGAGDFLKWVGIEPARPRTAVIETVEAIRRLLAGERAALDGQFLRWTDEAYLRFAPQRRHIPMYIGAMSPRMLETIGAVADGGLPLLFPPEHYSNVLPYIQAGAESAGRKLDDVDVAACIWCSVSTDRAAAEDALREKIAYYGHAFSPTIHAQLGLSAADFAPIEQAMMVENDVAKAKTLVTAPMLKIGVMGDARDLIARLETLADLGVKHISFGPPLGPHPLEAIETIGRDVLPHFHN
ncbi:MAG: LLM class flavin-dependent oxidoreductase [Chloroflexi bacterium]|nr:LLM class flavin-dependent oxidoreductase [Chloroflexota bacterium]